MTKDKRTCLCDHDLIWHGVGVGHSACRAQVWEGSMQWSCRCQGFRTTVPGETMPETDLLQMFWRLDLVLTRIESLLRERLPEPVEDDEERAR